MFPLESALLPGERVPLRVFEPRYSQLVLDCLAMSEPAFGVVLISQGSEVGGGDIRSDVGVLARITGCGDYGMGRYQLEIAAGERIRVQQWLPDDPYPRAAFEPWPDQPGVPVSDDRIGQVLDAILALYDRILDSPSGHRSSDVLAVEPEVAEDRARHIYALATRVPMSAADRYALLAAPALAERVDVLMDAIETATAIAEFQAPDE